MITFLRRMLLGADGEPSSTKTITAGTWVAATVVFVRVCWTAGPGEGVAVLLLTYVGLFVVKDGATRLIAARYGGKADPPPEGGDKK